jgi:DNA-binding MarR family transcriptional regulator
MQREQNDATVRVMNALRRVVRVLSASARRLPGNRRVSGAQIFVLRQIAASPGISIGELAARTLAGQSTVSEVVTRLVDQKLVSRSRSAHDARQAVLTLTSRGTRLIASIEPTAQERLAEGLAALPKAQREVLATGLESWLGAAGLADVPPTMFLEPARTIHPVSRRAAR